MKPLKIEYGPTGPQSPSAGVIIGLIFLPVIFGIALIEPGYSTRARAIALVWAIVWLHLASSMVGLSQNSPASVDAKQPTVQATQPEATPAPTPVQASTPEAPLPEPLNSYIQRKEAQPNHVITQEEFDEMGRQVQQQLRCGGIPCAR